MKPLLRYLRARLSGRDPHDILNRHGPGTNMSLSFWHASWWRDSSRSWRGGGEVMEGGEGLRPEAVAKQGNGTVVGKAGARGGRMIPSVILGDPFEVDVPTGLYADSDLYEGTDTEKEGGIT